jgi:threonylcarbamoyladenosine tRNA methylthiotransferase MtaB
VKFSVLSFGCRTNQADSCRIERRMIEDGGVSSPPGEADVVVVNTCTVTAAADQAARHAIRRVARLNPQAKIHVTGCYAARRPDEIGRLPGVVLLPRLVDTPTELPVTERAAPAASLHPGDRGRTAYPLRVQNGCDERCAYCIVPSTRGPGRSLPLRAVLDEVRGLSEAGFRQVWLTGVHLGSWGRDLQPPRSLFDLLQALDREAASLDITFRLSSLEPMDCGDEIVDLVAASPRFAPHLHLPLQHASNRILAAMRRPYTADRYREIVCRVRDRMPDAAIGTDLIVGFPGEAARDFDLQRQALDEWPLTHLHVFPYSDRPGTAAARMDERVPGAEIRRRAEQLRAIGREKTARFYERMVGRELSALTIEDGSLALTDNYLKLQIAPGRARNERIRVRPVSADPPMADVVS